MADPSCQVQEASVAVKYAESTPLFITLMKACQTYYSYNCTINKMHVFPSLFCSQIGTVSGCLSNKTATRHYGKR